MPFARAIAEAAPQLPAIVVTGDRLLWVWTAVPLALLALATVKNAHYAIAAQVPWSIWAALALATARRNAAAPRLESTGAARRARIGFARMALLYGMCLWLIAPCFDRRGVEWAFYESVGRRLPATASLAFLYDDWDRLPYECPFGSFPHDLAVRLFYLGRPACWHQGTESLLECQHAGARRGRAPVDPLVSIGAAGWSDTDFTVVGRERDLPELERLGRVEVLARTIIRADRSYSLFRISPRSGADRLSRQTGSRVVY